MCHTDLKYNRETSKNLCIVRYPSERSSSKTWINVECGSVVGGSGGDPSLAVGVELATLQGVMLEKHGWNHGREWHARQVSEIGYSRSQE
jgi:hypothetical protein